MTLVGCFVSPHPPIIIPEVGGGYLSQADPTVRAMRVLREKASVLAPDAIVLLSPHSALSAGEMGVSLASAYRGSLAYFRAPHVRLEFAGDQALARSIRDEAATHGVPVFASAEHGDVVELDHGAMVPLWYITGELVRHCRLVLLAFSYLSLEEHVRFGQSVGIAMMAALSRVLYVASADLSHRLLPEAPAGYDPRGAEFDQKVADTFAAGDWAALLSIDSSLVRAAGECGYRSLAVLSGVVAALEAAGIPSCNHLFSYEGPFGVGYLVGEVEVGNPLNGGDNR